jgi:hypothetical protein
VKWAYGVTTVPERREELLPKTLDSLCDAGFGNPRLFVDGENDIRRYDQFSLEVTLRYPKIRVFGNWFLSLIELYIREPNADRYAVFQDDFITYRNLREYLERTEYPDKSYLNLYTFPCNQQRCKEKPGWYLSDQFGKGAVALVFNRLAVQALITSQHMVDRPLDPRRGWRAVDGGIVSGMTKAGFKEYIHNPSLVQHTGDKSSMGNKAHQKALSFRGEDFDALELLE